jgi:Flp pilus assembly pilin Flp
MAYLVSFIHDEEGQDLVEYALLLSFIAVVSVVAITTLGTKVGSMWSKIGTPLT